MKRTLAARRFTQEATAVRYRKIQDLLEKFLPQLIPLTLKERELLVDRLDDAIYELGEPWYGGITFQIDARFSDKETLLLRALSGQYETAGMLASNWESSGVTSGILFDRLWPGEDIALRLLRKRLAALVQTVNDKFRQHGESWEINSVRLTDENSMFYLTRHK